MIFHKSEFWKKAGKMCSVNAQKAKTWLTYLKILLRYSGLLGFFTAH